LKDFRKHSGSVKCFEGLFDFSPQQDKYPGTIFRFPLRNQTSGISGTLFDYETVIKKLYKSLVEEAPYMLLFLKNIIKIGLYRYNVQQGCEELMYEVLVHHTSKHAVQMGRKLCREKAMSWQARNDIFCHLNSFSVSFKNNFMKTVAKEGTYHWLVMNCIAGKNCKQLEPPSRNLNVIPWAGVAAQLPECVHLPNGLVNSGISLSSGCLDIGNKCVSDMLDSLSRCKKEIPWLSDKLPEFPGHAFCFLPLPSCIGLPVFVHGYFSVADNRRSIKWPSHDEHGEEALFNKALVDNLIIPTYAFLLACRSSLIAYKEIPFLYENSQNMLCPYGIWPLHDSQVAYSIWSTVVEPVITLLLNHGLPVVWTAAGGGRRTSLLSAIYLPGTFTEIANDVPKIIVEVLMVLDKPLVILPKAVAKVIARIQDITIKQNIHSREISPSMIRMILKEALPFDQKISDILMDKHNCSSILAYILSDISEKTCHELQNISVLPVEKPNELPRPFVKQGRDCFYILDDKKCSSFLLEVTDQLIWSGLPDNVRQQLKRIVGYNQYQLKIADATTVCSELLPLSMSKWTKSNGEIVQWKPGNLRHPPFQWLIDIWNWLNKASLNENSINDLSIVPKECLNQSSPTINLIPLSYSGKCFLVSDFHSIPTFLPVLLENLGFMVVYETPLVFAQSLIKKKFNPISPDSIIKVLTNSIANINGIIESIKIQPHSDKVEFFHYIAQLTKSALTNEEMQVVRQLPLFKPIGSNHLVSLNNQEWILLTNGIQLPPNLQYPANIIEYSLPEECRLLRLLGCLQPTFTKLCTNHLIPFALSCAVDNMHKLMKWIMDFQPDEMLIKYLTSCKFVPRGKSGELVKACDLYDPEDPMFKQLFDPQEDCIPSYLYKDYLAALRRLGLQTWNTVSCNEIKLKQFLIDRAKSVSTLCNNNMTIAFNRSIMIVQLLIFKASPNLNKILSDELANIPFLFCQIQTPSDYPKDIRWYGEGSRAPFAPKNLYPTYYKLLVGSVGPVIHEFYSLECQLLSGILKIPNMSELFSQLKVLTSIPKPPCDISKIVYLIYKYFNENREHLLAEKVNLPPKWIWIEMHCRFVSADKCAVASLNGLDLSPYFFSLSQINQLKDFLNMFVQLGVPLNFSSNIVAEVFTNIKKECHGFGLDNSKLKTVLQILQWIHNNGQQNIEVLIPTENMQLLPPRDCTYNDLHWDERRMQQKGYMFVHREIPSQRAKYFQVIPLSHRIAPSKRIGLKYIQRGPHQSVTSRLKEAIEDYGGDVDVFKELIQNADDAHATQVKFIIDWRQHPCNTLLASEMKHWQGPALLAYNNAVFNPNDIENICELAGGSKKSDPTKIGRFGIGFCSIYHLTDVPSFISSNHFIVFDPHTSYLGNRVTAGEPGMQIDMKETYNNLSEFKDQFVPYCGLLDFDMTKAQKGYNSTLFRFPFRNDHTASKSKISPTIYNRERVQELCDALKKSAPELLVFLQNVREVSLYELDANSSVDNLKCILSVTKVLEPTSYFRHTLIEQFRQEYNLESCQKKIFKIECCIIGQAKQEDCWMVTSCLGSGNSKTISQSPNGKINGLCPLGEIGIKLDKSSPFVYPLSTNGTLFCFLPLPIECDLKFYCSGYFELSKERRNLKKIASGPELNEWNSAIISDALYNCFINTLVNLTNVSVLSSASKSNKNKFLAGYYSLWPNANCSSPVGRILFNKIKQSIHLTNKCILWSDMDGGKWLFPKSAFVYNHHDKVNQDIRKDIIQLLLQYRYPIADIPYNIKSIMGDSIKIIHYRDFCSQVLIPNIATLPVEVRDNQIIALLLHLDSAPDTQWAEKLLKCTPCIPTRPNGRLRKPNDLIDPHSNLAKLYSDNDECFPIEIYINKVADALRRLGMSHFQLTLDKLKSRASSVVTLPDREAVERSKQILLYLSHAYQGLFGLTTDVHDALQNIPFIPVSRCPQRLSLPWYKSPTLFQSPKIVFSYKHEHLVFTQAPTVMLFDDGGKLTIDGLSKLGVEGKYPSVTVVMAHLVCLAKHFQQNTLNQNDYKLLDDCCPSIYHFLQQVVTSPMQSHFKQGSRLLKGLPFIWQNNHFFTVDQITLDSKIGNGYPYLCQLSDGNKKYEDLFTKLGVAVELDQKRLLSVLESIYHSHTNEPLSGEHIQFVYNIAMKLDHSHSLHECDRIVYLPDENGVMRPASMLAYKESVDLPALNDSEILARHFRKGTFWLHRIFSATVAKSLGIPSALNSILNEMSNKNFLSGTEYGQCEDLCDRLNSILRKYPHDESIFKEFIQNADDAGASEIVFILDHRKFDSQDGKLFSSDPEWKQLHQYPSLLVYNNKLMTEEDIIGITKLGKGNKGFSPDLIGRFGIGFNVAYHITDCVTYVSYGPGAVPENFCILDPGGLFTPGHHQMPLRGRRFEMNALTRQQFSKEFDPFYNHKVFLQMRKMCDGCFRDISTNFHNGCVLFRFPFTRSIDPPCNTELKSGFKMKVKHMQKLFQALSHSAEHLLLFLNNIKSLSAFEIQQNGSCLHHFTASVSQSSMDVAICTERVKKLKLEIKNLKSGLCHEDDNASIVSYSHESSNTASRDTENVQNNSFSEIYWDYQLRVQTVVCTPLTDANSKSPSVCKNNSVWFISQQFGSKQIPTSILKAAVSDGLTPRGGVAVRVYSTIERTTPCSLFCSLPLPLKSHMPVHVNGNFWVDDSRKHLEFGASRSPLTDWNCCLTRTVIADAYVNALVCCQKFLPDKSTDWYYSIFPTECGDSDSKDYPFGLCKTMYQKIVQKNLQILQQDTSSLTGIITWLPVVGKNHGYFFFPTEEGQQMLRKLLIEFGVKLSKAPVEIYNEIYVAATACKIKYNALISPVIYIQILKSLNLQQHRETIIKNIIVLLKYCLSNEEGCGAIKDAPLLLTYSGSLRQMSPVVYGSCYSQVLPHKSDDFIHPELEKHEFISKLSSRRFYNSLPGVDYVSSHLQLQTSATPVDIDKCTEVHSQVIELWKYLNSFLCDVKTKYYVTSLNRFSNKPIIPASNKMLVPVCKAKMVLSPNGGGPVRKIMKLFGYPVLDFGILCDLRFHTFAEALDKILTHCNNGDDILKCIELNNSSPALPSSCNLTEYKEDLQLFLNIISTSMYLNFNFLCKLPIFEAITGDIYSIKDLQNTYLIPNDVPLMGLNKVMKNSPMLILKDLPVYVKVYKCVKIQRCDVAQFYLKAIIPYLQAMNTKDIIEHIQFLFRLNIDKQKIIIGDLKASEFIYVANSKRWCSASEFYDPSIKLFKVSFPEDRFPPQEWCTIELLQILHCLGLKKNLSWKVLFDMVKDVEQQIKQNVKKFDKKLQQYAYCKSKELLGFIHDKLPVTQDRRAGASEDDHVDSSLLEALQFCKDISEIVFIPTYEDDSIKKKIFTEVQFMKPWTKFNTACFASHYETTFLERDVITSSFSLSSDQHCYSTALGIEDPPSCETVIKNLLRLSQVTQSQIQSNKKHHVSIKDCIKKLFNCHYKYLEGHASPVELCSLQNKECIFVENLTYFVVSGDCVVKSLPESLFPYLCRITEDLTEHHKIITALKISDEPSSYHYARVLEKIYHEFTISKKKLSKNPKYLELANRVCDYLVDVLHTEEENESVPESFKSIDLYLLDKQNELRKATDLVYDDVPWYSKRLQSVASYKYMKPLCQDKQNIMYLPKSLGVKPLSSLVVEELDESVQLPDNHCADERRALQRGQPHGCLFILSLENLLLSSDFKLGIQRIIYHQKHEVELDEREIAVTDKLSKLKFSCYYKIITVLKQKNGQVIQGSSVQSYSVLCEDPNQNPLLCLAPHCEDKDTVVKELAQNINRYLSSIVLNESHLEAMIKCPSHLDIEAALDKCKVKSYMAADQSVQKLPSVGQTITPNITDLLIVLNYNKGESVKYWNEDGKLILAKIVAVKSRLLVDVTAKSLTVCTSEGNDNTKINTSAIFVSKYLQPSFLKNWFGSEKKEMDCSGLLLYHLQYDHNPLIIQKEVMLSFKNLSNCQISVVFQRLFFHFHFYFVKCNKQPQVFNELSVRYFEEQVTLFEPSLQPKLFNKWLVKRNLEEQAKLLEQLPKNEEYDKLSELFEDMCIYTSGEPDSENDQSDICDEDMADKNPFENREFLEQDSEISDNLCYRKRKQNIHYRKAHLQKAANISGTTRSQRKQINAPSQPTSIQQAPLSSGPTFANAFSQPVVHSAPTSGRLFRTSTGGYRSHVRCPRSTPVSVWNQNATSQAEAALPANSPPKTNFKTAFMWLQQAIADFNAAKHYVECTNTVVVERVNSSGVSSSDDEMETDNYPCQFPALICFLSHEVVEKSLKAVFLAKCGFTLANQHNLNLVALYDQLSTARCWPLMDVKDFVLQVSDYNVRCRYPDHHIPPETPCVLYNGLDARHALAAAQEVFVKVCNIDCFKDQLPSQPCALPLLPSTVYLDPNSKF